MINNRKVIRTLISYIPVLKFVLKKSFNSNLPGSYYFNVYQKHKNELLRIGASFPGDKIGELGPGETFGVGLSALLDGFNQYYALDIIKHFNEEKNLKALKEVAQYFPTEIEKIEQITEQLLSKENHKSINFSTTWSWDDNDIINSFDFIISNAVLEHVPDLKDIYLQMHSCLKNGGFVSNVIDYSAHEFSNNWFEYLYLSNNYWRFLMHGRMFPINRLPHSYHLKCLNEVGFTIISDIKNYSKPANRSKIDESINYLFSDEDLSIRGSHIIAVKN